MAHGGREVCHSSAQIPWPLGLVWLVIGQSAVLLRLQGLDGLLQKHEAGSLLSREVLQAVITLETREITHSATTTWECCILHTVLQINSATLLQWSLIYALLLYRTFFYISIHYTRSIG